MAIPESSCQAPVQSWAEFDVDSLVDKWKKYAVEMAKNNKKYAEQMIRNKKRIRDVALQMKDRRAMVEECLDDDPDDILKKSNSKVSQWLTIGTVGDVPLLFAQSPVQDEEKMSAAKEKETSGDDEGGETTDGEETKAAEEENVTIDSQKDDEKEKISERCRYSSGLSVIKGSENESFVESVHLDEAKEDKKQKDIENENRKTETRSNQQKDDDEKVTLKVKPSARHKISRPYQRVCPIDKCFHTVKGASSEKVLESFITHIFEEHPNATMSQPDHVNMLFSKGKVSTWQKVRPLRRLTGTEIELLWKLIGMNVHGLRCSICSNVFRLDFAIRDMQKHFGITSASQCPFCGVIARKTNHVHQSYRLYLHLFQVHTQKIKQLAVPVGRRRRSKLRREKESKSRLSKEKKIKKPALSKNKCLVLVDASFKRLCYSCSHCCKQYSTWAAFSRHLDFNHPTPSYQCSSCMIILHSHAKLLLHMKTCDSITEATESTDTKLQNIEQASEVYEPAIKNKRRYSHCSLQKQGDSVDVTNDARVKTTSNSAKSITDEPIKKKKLRISHSSTQNQEGPISAIDNSEHISMREETMMPAGSKQMETEESVIKRKQYYTHAFPQKRKWRKLKDCIDNVSTPAQSKILNVTELSTSVAGSTKEGKNNDVVVITEQVKMAKVIVSAAPTSYKCEPCYKEFMSTATFNLHLSASHPDIIFICKYCEETFKSEKPVMGHVRRCYTTSKSKPKTTKYECPYPDCNKFVLQSFSEFKRHMIICHYCVNLKREDTSMEYYCVVQGCKSVSDTTEDLMKHFREHSDTLLGELLQDFDEATNLELSKLCSCPFTNCGTLCVNVSELNEHVFLHQSFPKRIRDIPFGPLVFSVIHWKLKCSGDVEAMVRAICSKHCPVCETPTVKIDDIATHLLQEHINSKTRANLYIQQMQRMFRITDVS